MDKFEFGRYLRMLRGNKSTRQIELQTGVSKSYISLLERGLREVPSPEVLKKLSVAYNVSYESLMEAAGYIKNSEKYVLDNLRLVMGDMTPKQFADYIGRDDITEEHIKAYMNEEITPGFGTLYFIAEAIGIDIDFFYRPNTKETLEQNKCDYVKEKESSYETKDVYQQLIDRIKENNIDVNVINGFIDLLISQNKKSTD